MKQSFNSALIVVIGSQKFVPLVSGTTYYNLIPPRDTLWLALKSLYLWYLEQRIFVLLASFWRCDWLSKVCTFGIWNNKVLIRICERKLWLALKSLYLWYLEQPFYFQLLPCVLWLALKSLYLWYLEQRQALSVSEVLCCDWLSKVCTFGIWNNLLSAHKVTQKVVIGSQKFVPLVSGTTSFLRIR